MSEHDHSWEVHVPEGWDRENVPSIVRDDTQFVQFCNNVIDSVDGFTDGEVVDALEHFFWGMSNGLALEMGALDGSTLSRSITAEYERFGWRRLLVEGDLSYRQRLPAASPRAYCALAPICERSAVVHFLPAQYVGGVAEFMSEAFLKQYHPRVFAAGRPPGNLSSVDWAALGSGAVSLQCVPLSHILHRARKQHYNFFVLDVEGGELEVLRSIDFTRVVFDVLCVETAPADRPPGYAAAVSALLAKYGYSDCCGQIGRNTWYVHEGYSPRRRPGLAADCFSGSRHSIEADTAWTERRKPHHINCPLLTIPT